RRRSISTLRAESSTDGASRRGRGTGPHGALRPGRVSIPTMQSTTTRAPGRWAWATTLAASLGWAPLGCGDDDSMSTGAGTPVGDSTSAGDPTSGDPTSVGPTSSPGPASSGDPSADGTTSPDPTHDDDDAETGPPPSGECDF